MVREDGSLVDPGESGELFSRSPYLMNGYLNDPAATAACTTDDGFLTSGDVVVVDEEGFISIVDRKKDLIITGGANVYPREIEEVLATHDGVAECAVIGINDETWGERIVAPHRYPMSGPSGGTLALRSAMFVERCVQAITEHGVRTKRSGWAGV